MVKAAKKVRWRGPVPQTQTLYSSTTTGRHDRVKGNNITILNICIIIKCSIILKLCDDFHLEVINGFGGKETS